MTTVSNLVADTLIMADKSELNRTIEAYREQYPDWSEEKLRSEAWKDLAIQTGWDVVGGTVQGICGFPGKEIRREQGANIEAMVAQQLDAADEFDKTVPENQRIHMTEAMAFEEVVADEEAIPA